MTPSRPTGLEKEPDDGYYPGLVNISGTYCFMNSTLQVRSPFLSVLPSSCESIGPCLSVVSPTTYRCHTYQSRGVRRSHTRCRRPPRSLTQSVHISLTQALHLIVISQTSTNQDRPIVLSALMPSSTPSVTNLAAAEARSSTPESTKTHKSSFSCSPSV